MSRTKEADRAKVTARTLAVRLTEADYQGIETLARAWDAGRRAALAASGYDDAGPADDAPIPDYVRWWIRSQLRAHGVTPTTTTTLSTTPAPAPSAPRAAARQRDLFAAEPVPVAAPVVAAPVVAEPAPSPPTAAEPAPAAEPATTSTKGPKGKRPASSTTTTKATTKAKATPAAEPATVDADAVRRVLVARYEAKAVKLAELAAACGANPSQLTRFKNGDTFPPARLPALAAALGMTP